MPDFNVRATLTYTREVEFTVTAESEDAARDEAENQLRHVKDQAASEEGALSALPDWSGGSFDLFDFEVDGVDEAT